MSDRPSRFSDFNNLPPRKKSKRAALPSMPVLDDYKTSLLTKLSNRRSRSAERCREVLLTIDPRKSLCSSADVQRALLELPMGQDLLHYPSFIALLVEVDAEQQVGTAVSQN